MNKGLQNAANSVSTPIFLTSRADIVEVYKDRYGEAGWRKHIVDDLQKQHPGAKRASLAREFQYDRKLGAERYKAGKVSKGTAEKYKGLGQSLPPVGRVPKKDSIVITIEGKQKGNKGHKERDRTIKVTLSGDRAQHFVNEPNWSDIWDVYGFDFGIDDEEGDIDPDYTLTGVSVSAA